MGTNVALEKGKLKWLFDLEGVEELYDSYRATDVWDLVEGSAPEETVVDVVRAANGLRWGRGTLDRLRRLKRGYHVLPDCGHWLHVDNPQGLLALMEPSLSEAAYSSLRG